MTMKGWTPDAVRRHQEKMAGNVPAKTPDAPGKKKKSKDGMNGTERAYYNILLARKYNGEILEVLPHESMNVKVGAKRCWYKPDFAVIALDGQLEFHEVKGGFYRDDARVKFQSAKLQFPHFKWVWAQKTSQGWKII